MKVLTLYVKPENIVYTGDSGQGIIGRQDVESLIGREKAGALNIIVSKPDMVFRKIEVPFTSIRKIKLILPQELEEILPEDPFSYYYHFEFKRLPGGKRIINVYALKEDFYNYWRNVSKKCGARVSFFSDTMLLDSLLKRRISEAGYIGVYSVEKYLLANVVEGGNLSGSFSFSLKESEAEETRSMLENIFSSRRLPIFFLGNEDIKLYLRGMAGKAEEINFIPDMDREFVFPFLIKSKPYKHQFLRPRKLSAGKKFPLYPVSLLLVLLFSFLLSSLPYMRLPERERLRDAIMGEMKSKFQAACPDVTRVVDPLVQIKEKIAEKEGKIDTVSGYPPVLKAMADITALFPEDVDVEIEQFTLAGDNLTIAGRIGSLNALEEVKRRSKNSQEFKDAVIGSVSFDDRERVTFTLTLGISENE